ncbi:hypothetical protein Tco_1561977 [Tanacetum coccineum]
MRCARAVECENLSYYGITPWPQRLAELLRYWIGIFRVGATPEMVASTEPKTIQKAVQISGALTDEAVRNGSIKKVKKRGIMGETSKDKNGGGMTI